MVQRVITALIIIACVVPPLLFGGWLLNLLVGLIVVVGGYELMELLPNYKKMPPLFYVLIQLICFALLFVNAKFRFALLGIAIIVIMAFPIFFKQITSKDCFILSAIFVLFFTFATAFLTIYKEQPNFIWLILLATYGCDTGAYFTGYFFGKHKLCERISPKKTIEGSIGGIVFSLVLSGIFCFFFIKGYSIVFLTLVSVMMPIVSQIGDLAFSAIKRNYGIKDFSNIFPGHGGFMDRVDSLVYNLVLFYFIMLIFI